MERAAPRPAPAISPTRAPQRTVAGPAAGTGACPARRAPVPYLPRRPEHSPLYRVLADHFETLARVHEEHFEPSHGPLRAVARQAVGRFLDCGLLENGFARVRCPTCRAEFLVAFRAWMWVGQGSPVNTRRAKWGWSGNSGRA
jgi:hypothetical protein